MLEAWPQVVGSNGIEPSVFAEDCTQGAKYAVSGEFIGSLEFMQGCSTGVQDEK